MMLLYIIVSIILLMLCYLHPKVFHGIQTNLSCILIDVYEKCKSLIKDDLTEEYLKSWDIPDEILKVEIDDEESTVYFKHQLNLADLEENKLLNRNVWIEVSTEKVIFIANHPTFEISEKIVVPDIYIKFEKNESYFIHFSEAKKIRKKWIIKYDKYCKCSDMKIKTE